jgi:methenyltetrahydromethanopterin cyclohydrolase
MSTTSLSLNAQVVSRVRALLADAAALGLEVTTHATGARIMDAGIKASGGVEAGIRIAEVCMGGLGQVSLAPAGEAPWAHHLIARSSLPVLACLASQYAGWSLNHEWMETSQDGVEKRKKFNALGSGPARAIACKEPLFAELNYKDAAQPTCLVLEVDKFPPDAIIEKVIRDCGIAGNDLTVILTPTQSLAGITQIVARVLEVALHKAHTLHFPLANIVEGIGMAPLAPPSADFIVSMGRSNDAILFGGYVQLFVKCSDDEARQLAAQLPCTTSRNYGEPFAEIFKAMNYDFYQIDPLLFAPAQVLITNLTTGASFAGGHRNAALLARSFGAGV